MHSYGFAKRHKSPLVVSSMQQANPLVILGIGILLACHYPLPSD
jgi:hypothetical protein